MELFFSEQLRNHSTGLSVFHKLSKHSFEYSNDSPECAKEHFKMVKFSSRDIAGTVKKVKQEMLELWNKSKWRWILQEILSPLMKMSQSYSSRRDITISGEIYVVVIKMLRSGIPRRNFNILKESIWWWSECYIAVSQEETSKLWRNPYGGDGDVTPLATSDVRGWLVMIWWWLALFCWSSLSKWLPFGNLASPSEVREATRKKGSWVNIDFWNNQTKTSEPQINFAE